MKSISEQTLYETTDLAVNLPALLTNISCLMTCYAVNPSAGLARIIQRHIGVLLTSPLATELEEWESTFIQLHTQWDCIIQRHQSLSM